MDKAQFEATLDSLVAEFNGAIKYQPMLQDLDNGKAVTDDELAAIRAKALAQAQASHAIAIAALKSELANDPAHVGYSGKTGEEVQKLLTTEAVVTEDVAAPPLLRGIIDKAIANVFAVTPQDLGVLADGTVVGDYPQLANEIGVLVTNTGQTMEDLEKPRTTQVEKFRRPPPVALIWHGIPYARNIPSLENINEALKR